MVLRGRGGTKGGVLTFSRELEELAVVIKRKVISGKSYDDANLLIINVVRDCLMAVISKSSELELPPYRYSIELLTFQAKMKIHESIKYRM